MSVIRKFSNRLLNKGGHTLIVGWSALGLEVLRELTEANRNVRKPRLVILSTDSVEQVEKDLAALSIGRQRFQIHQVAKSEVKNRAKELAASARSVVDLQKSQTKLIKQIEERCANNPPLTSAVDELLSFVGEEIYFRELPALKGKTFADAVLAFNTAAVFGLVIDGTAQINPSPKTLLPPGSKVIALAEDDDKVVYTGIREDALAKLNLRVKRSALKEILVPSVSKPQFNNLKAKLLAQFSENPELESVYSELFTQSANTIFVAPITALTTLGQSLDFAELAVAAISRGYSAIGYVKAESAQVILNPAKTQVFTANQGDGLVVIGSL
jgi:K+/H+ antiporter YhaU regulatory subunit KhtT